jgi:hypothetical protein
LSFDSRQETAVSANAEVFLPQIANLNPSFAKCTAVAAPIPELAPWSKKEID